MAASPAFQFKATPTAYAVDILVKTMAFERMLLAQRARQALEPVADLGASEKPIEGPV